MIQIQVLNENVPGNLINPKKRFRKITKSFLCSKITKLEDCWAQNFKYKQLKMKNFSLCFESNGLEFLANRNNTISLEFHEF